MDEADLPLAGIVREHGGGLMDFHRMKGIERLTGSSDWDFYSGRWKITTMTCSTCERENAADVLADLPGIVENEPARHAATRGRDDGGASTRPWNRSTSACTPPPKRGSKERALDLDGNATNWTAAFISEESFDGICGD